MSFVETPAALDRYPHPVGGVEDDPQGADRPREHRGEGDGGTELLAQQFAPGLRRLEQSLFAQVDVVPAGEQVIDIPGALSVADQNQFSRHDDPPIAPIDAI